MKITALHHVALLTSNFDRLRTFYVDLLGFPVVGAYSDRHIIFVGVDSIAIELIERVGVSNDKSGGWGHFAFEVEDVKAGYKALAELGVPFHILPNDLPEGQPVSRIAFFRDPDGNELQLVQPLGPGRYPTVSRGGRGEDTASLTKFG